jgi:branched-chain amino acid aminotransferase
MAIPLLDEKFLLASLKELLKIDGHWTPSHPGSSLYIRPTVIATESHLGVRPSREYLYFTILSPVGPYYREGFSPIKIYIEDFYSRSATGGLGAIKAGANYANSLLATEKANQKGYTQLLWLDSNNHRFVEEVGSMNMFFVIDNTILTSPLTGSILPGITRDSVMAIAKDLALKAEERPLEIKEILEAQKSGNLTEAFGSGTAAIISPVGHLCYKENEFPVADGKVGKITQLLYDKLVGIQYGNMPDKKGWIEFVD